MTGKELEGQQVSLESVARTACHHEVARIMCTATGERHDVVERGRVLVESRGAIHTTLPAVAQRNLSHGAFHREVCTGRTPDALLRV